MTRIPESITACMDAGDLQLLFDVLKQQGYEVVGPTLREGAIVYDTLEYADDLPVGWTDEQDAGSYKLKRRSDRAFFGYNVGPHAWKKYLFPPSRKMWEAVRTDTGFDLVDDDKLPPKYAFVGVRACELRAMEIQGRVFQGGTWRDEDYVSRRAGAFVVAVNCGQAANTCFCTSMQSGPRAARGFDLALTEIITENSHYFTVETGSSEGVEVLKALPHRPATPADLEASLACTQKAEAEMGRAVDMTDIKDLLYRNYDNKRWAELEKKCLACGNCTMVCPTCFCSTVEDTTDLNGQRAARWRTWDSCFTMDFTHVHGGSIRPSIQSRYRQWLMHKLATWFDQFGTSGCVGCGRCITWCPVGIDLTQEVKAIRELEKHEKEELS